MVWGDVVGAEDCAGVLVGDGCLVVVEEDEDRFSGVFVADSEVVEFACAAEGEFAELVDSVAADPVVGCQGFVVRGGFDGRVLGLLRGEAAEGSVGSVFVVDGSELRAAGGSDRRASSGSPHPDRRRAASG